MSERPTDEYLKALVDPEAQVGAVVKDLAGALLVERELYRRLIDTYDFAIIEIARYEEILAGCHKEIDRLRKVVVMCPEHHP